MREGRERLMTRNLASVMAGATKQLDISPSSTLGESFDTCCYSQGGDPEHHFGGWRQSRTAASGSIGKHHGRWYGVRSFPQSRVDRRKESTMGRGAKPRP